MADIAGAKAAIRQRLEQNWSATRITYQNEDPAAPWPPMDVDGGLLPFINLEVLVTGSDVFGIAKPGNHVWQYSGLIYVHVYVPVGQGTAQADQLASQAGEIFRAAQFYDTVTPGCYVRTNSPRISGGGSGDDEGLWFLVSAVIDFTYWHRG